MNKNPITIEATINAPLAKVWDYWTDPSHIERWAFAQDDWEALNAKNDLRVGGTFSTTMAAKDKSASFDFAGEYTALKEHGLIEYQMTDGRQVRIEFSQVPAGVRVVQTFDPESENSEEVQRSGWQSILDNFKKYVESN